MGGTGGGEAGKGEALKLGEAPLAKLVLPLALLLLLLLLQLPTTLSMLVKNSPSRRIKGEPRNTSVRVLWRVHTLSSSCATSPQSHCRQSASDSTPVASSKGCTWVW
jgi:hypothetical protein